MSTPGLTTQPAFVATPGAPNVINMRGAQDSAGNFSPAYTPVDQNGAPIAVSLDSSVQEVVSALSTANTALSIIESNTTGLATSTGQATANNTLSSILGKLGSVVLAAGTAIIGKVSIDQSTPGTTNGVAVNSSALPAGAAVSSLQPAISGDGGSLAHVTNFPATQPISVASLPLPSGAATAANQATEIASLATIASAASAQATAANQTTQITQETATATNTGAVSTATGTTADTAYTGTGTASIVAALKGIYAKLAGSLSVTGTFWQATQPVSVASLPLPTGGATSANQATEISSLAAISTNTTGVALAVNQPALNGDGGALAHVTNFPATQPISAAALPLPTGAATDTSVQAITTSLGTDGSTPPTLPAGSTGVRGWLRYIAAQFGAVAITSSVLPTNAAQETGGNLATIATAQGAGATGISQPAGGSGALGWLSGIFNKLNTSVAVTGTFYQATQPISAATLPLPNNAAQETGNLATVATAQGTGGAGISQPSGGSGILGWLSGIYSKLSGSIAVTGTFWQTTQPVSLASSPLPTGAATSALQPGYGSAGNPSANVESIQGVAGGTPVPISGTVSISGGSGTQNSNITQFGGTNVVTGTGVGGAGIPRVTVSSDSSVSVSASALPTGAAQDGTDGTGISQPTGGVGIRGWLSGIYSKLSGSIAVTGTFYQATQPVSLASSPLPSNAAQETGGNLAAILTKLGAVVLSAGTALIGKVGIDQTTPGTTNGVVVNSSALPTGAALESGGNLGTIAVAQGAGATGITQPTGGSGILGWLSGIYSKLSGSIAVTGTFYQATQPVSLASSPLPSNAAQETGGNLAAILTKLGAVVLSAGTALIGKVGIDQTTPGTTNGVVVNSSALPTGAALESGGNLGTIAVAQGAGATGITQPTGGSGILGWLSGIYSKLNTSIAVTGTFYQTTQPVSAASLPLPAGAATSANQPAVNGDGGALAHVTNFPSTQPVSAASLPLPTGAATSANQPGYGTAGTPSANVVSIQGVSGGTAQAVTVASLPLPTGAATSANQATEISSLSTIATNTTGAATSANQTSQITQETTTATNTTAISGATGTTADTAYAGSGNTTIIGGLKGLYTRLGSIVLGAGSALIGKVGIDQTTPGTTNKVAIGGTASASDGTCTTGGTAQNLFGGATPTNGYSICNASASDTYWFSDSTTAAPNTAGSMPLYPNGGYYETPPGYIPFGAVSLYMPTTSDPYTARKW